MSPSLPEDRVARKRKQLELLQRGQALRNDAAKPTTNLRKRFWKDVTVKSTDGMSNPIVAVSTPLTNSATDGFHILLDTRPVRTAAKQILTLPSEKRALASAIALEWDMLVSAQQATKQHYIPLTSLTSRAVDLQQADAKQNPKIREEIIQMLLRYLSTDTLLCWAPEKDLHDYSGMAGTIQADHSAQSLRDKQISIAEPIIGHLKTNIFPGVEIHPVLDEGSIMPKSQPEMTQQIIRGWLHGLPAFELAALERGVLATKSLLIAVRLLVEWSKEFRHLQPREAGAQRFGIAQAAAACSVELTWQTDMWGEVEDTHDVDKEDLARQLGSVVLLVS